MLKIKQLYFFGVSYTAWFMQEVIILYEKEALNIEIYCRMMAVKQP